MRLLRELCLMLSSIDWVYFFFNEWSLKLMLVVLIYLLTIIPLLLQIDQDQLRGLDNKNEMDCYVKISLEDIEEYLKR